MLPKDNSFFPEYYFYNKQDLLQKKMKNRDERNLLMILKKYISPRRAFLWHKRCFVKAIYRQTNMVKKG